MTGRRPGSLNRNWIGWRLSATIPRSSFHSPIDRLTAKELSWQMFQAYPDHSRYPLHPGSTDVSWIRTTGPPRHFELLGRVAGELHNHSEAWSPPTGFDRPTYDAEGLFGSRSKFPLDEIGPAPVRRDLETVYGRLTEAEQQMGCDTEMFGLIHADLSFGNVLFRPGHAIAIDFGDCGFGYYLYEIAVILAGPYGRPGFQERSDALLKGYREVRSLSMDLEEYIPTLMASRAAANILEAAAKSPDHSLIESQWRYRVQPLLRTEFPG